MFQIDWQIDDSCWEKAETFGRLNPGGSYFDLQGLPFNRGLLEGKVTIFVGDVALFTSGHPDEEGVIGRYVCLSSLAIFLTKVVESWSELSATNRLEWSDPEGAAAIRFTNFGPAIEVVSIEPTLRPIVVPTADLLTGSVQFLNDFVGDLERNAPSTLRWNCFNRVLPHASPGFQKQCLQHLADEADASVFDHEEQSWVAPVPERLNIQWNPEDIDWQLVRNERRLNPPGSSFDVTLEIQRRLFLAPLKLIVDSQLLTTPRPINWDPASYERALDRRGSIGVVSDVNTSWNYPWPLLGLALHIAKRFRPRDFYEPVGEQLAFWVGIKRDTRAFLQFGQTQSEVSAIRPSLFDELKDLVGVYELDAALLAFLHLFVAAIRDRVPRALDWNSLSVLRRYVYPE